MPAPAEARVVQIRLIHLEAEFRWRLQSSESRDPQLRGKLKHPRFERLRRNF